MICVVYLPPSYSSEQYLDVLTCTENAINMYTEYPIMIVGDFNLNSCNNSVRSQFNNFMEYSTTM